MKLKDELYNIYVKSKGMKKFRPLDLKNNKPVINLTIGDVRTDLKVGTRIKGIRKEDGLSLDMMVRTVSYDFSGLTTKVSGDGTISVIEQTSVYCPL